MTEITQADRDADLIDNPKYTDISGSGDPVAWMYECVSEAGNHVVVPQAERQPYLTERGWIETALYSADRIEALEAENERLREELMQIEVDAMEYYNDWMEHGCEQVEATRFAFDLGQYARAALAGDSHD